jgi:PAS domain S-box-containing protein
MRKGAEPTRGSEGQRSDTQLSETQSSWVLAAVASLSEAIFVIDEHARIVYFNDTAQRIAGLGKLAWPDDFQFFESDERSPVPPDELPIRRALRGIETRDTGIFIRSPLYPDGLHVVSSASAIRDFHGEIRGAASVWRDVSATRRNEAQLRESIRQKQAILDNIPDMAWLKDKEGHYLLMNEQIARATGRTTASMVGATDADLWPTAVAERYRAGDRTVIESGEQLRIEEPFIDAAGNERWIETVKLRIVDDSGAVIGTTGIARDVTARRTAAEQTQRAKEDLERRFRERTAELAVAQENLVRQERLAILGQLAGGVAHQIRNPLAAIMNASYVLRRHLSPEQHPNVGDAIRIIHDEVRHANIIITGLLDYARVRTPDLQPTSLVDVLSRLLDAEWIPASVRVVRELPADDPVIVDVDADQLQGAIANLVRNAVEAMPDGGQLRVSLVARRGESDDAGGITIRIQDDGPGISAQVRPHLFEPLHSTKPLGIGLGLVTARRFVEAHGGRIALVDVPSGACFEIRLPRG